MAAPVIQTYTEKGATGQSTTIELTKPSGVAVGDLLVLLVGNEDTGAAAEFSDNLSGWNFLWDTGNGTSDCHIAAFWRIATGGEGATVTITAASSDYMFGWYLRIDGHNADTPINASGAEQIGSGSSTAIGGVSTDVADCLCIALGAFDGADGVPATVSGTGWSEKDEVGSSGGSSGVGACFATKNHSGTGSAGTCTINCNTSDGNCGRQFAIAPVAEGITSVAPTEFDYDNADIDINGAGFEASQGTGTVYISDADTLAGSANEV
jgi:hypothetical protein